MTQVNKPYSFSNGTPADANQVNQDFDTIYNDINGQLDDTNMKVGGVSKAIATEGVHPNQTEGVPYASDLFKSSFILSGINCTKDGSTLNQLDVTAGIIYIQQADGSLRRFSVLAVNFRTAAASSTYYLDFQPDGTWNWGGHSTQSGYLNVATVTTDASGNISTVTQNALSGAVPMIGGSGVQNVLQYGAKGDGVTDDTAAIAAAVSATPAYGKLVFPTASYIGELNITKPIFIDFMGSTLIPPNGSDNIISIAGTQGANNYILNGAVSRHAKTLTLTVAPTDIVAGSLIVLRDDTVRFSDNTPDVNLEVHEVLSAAGATLTLKDYVRLPKAVSATANVYVINPVSDVHIENVKLQAVNGATGNAGILTNMAKNVNLRNITMTNSVGPCVTFRKSYQCKLDGFNFSAPQATGSGQGYGVQGAYGTMQMTVLNGYADSMRHTVDSGNAFDLYVNNVESHNCAWCDFGLSHNGWDSDSTWNNCRAYNTSGYGFEAGNAGVSNLYTLTFYGIKINDCEVQTTGSSPVALYFQAPVKESKVSGFTATHTDGTGSNPQSEVGVRLTSVENDIVMENIALSGYKFSVSQDTSSTDYSRVQSEDAARLVIKNARINNASYGLYGAFIHNLHMEDVTFNKVTTKCINISTNSTGQMLRYLTLKNIKLRQFTAGTLINYSGTTNSNGVSGEIGNFNANNATNDVAVPATGYTVALEDMMLRSGDLARLNAAAAATLTGIANGIVEGQRLRIISVGASSITIPNSTTVKNNGATSVTLSTSKQGAEYVWSSGAWWQVA